MTDIDIYQPPALEPTRLVMTPDAAKELDDQLRACTRAVLREGTDYGVIPGTGDRKVLFKSGAEKLLQWFGFAFTMERLDVETDDDGRKQGVTYRCGIVRRLPDGGVAVIAACEGYAGYEETKFYQPADEAAQFKAEARERKYAKIDGRPANPNKWKNLPEYRAPWNTVMKMAQKRAIVGATIYATAAGGLFGTEEDASPAADDGSTWYEQAQETAGSFTDPADEGRLYVEAARAHRDGLCSRKQTDEIQYMIRKRGRQLKAAGPPVEVEELGRQAAAQHEDSAPAVPDETAPGGPAAGAAPGELVEEQPGTVSKAQLTKLHTVLTGLGFTGEDREQKLKVTETIARRSLDGPPAGKRTSANLSWTEARKVIDTLDSMDRDQLIAYMAEREAGETDG